MVLPSSHLFRMFTQPQVSLQSNTHLIAEQSFTTGVGAVDGANVGANVGAVGAIDGLTVGGGGTVGGEMSGD